MSCCSVFSQAMFLYLAFYLIALCCSLCVEIPGLFIQNRNIWPAWVWTQNKQGSRNTVHASQSFEKPHIVLNASKWPDVWLLDRHLPMKLCNQHHQWILQSSERHLLIPDFIDSIFQLGKGCNHLRFIWIKVERIRPIICTSRDFGTGGLPTSAALDGELEAYQNMKQL